MKISRALLCLASLAPFTACTTMDNDASLLDGSRKPASYSVHAECAFDTDVKYEYLRLFTNWIKDPKNIEVGIRPPCQEKVTRFRLTTSENVGGVLIPVNVNLTVVDNRASGGEQRYCSGEDEVPVALSVTPAEPGAGGKKVYPAKITLKSGKTLVGSCFYSDL